MSAEQSGEHPSAFTAPPTRRGPADRRLFLVSALAVLIALGAALLAEVLVALINLFTNISFYGRFALTPSTPAENTLGLWVILIPVIGGLIVGVMARWGSPAIRGHGIPEVMERILVGESRIPPRLTILKPVGTAISIGTGGPFGAEGPIIATGGALGSMVGQALRVTADERKVLLAAGAAAGMSAIFGAPISATILAVELLLFEYRARSLAPVALASAAAAAVRVALHGPGAVFPMEIMGTPSGAAITTYTLIGVFIGALGVGITKTLYRIEDAFEHLPIHWMWWPAIGGVVVGVMGYFSPRTLGVGYDNISGLLDGSIAGHALLVLVLCKLISWSIALGSGTAGGTLAPLFTIGGGAGVLVGTVVAAVLPSLGVDPRIAGLVGMAAAFTGASRALLASVVFAFEATRQPAGLLPLLAGCTGAYLISLRTMKETIMTERLARRGTPVITEYSADYLARVLVEERASKQVITLPATRTLREVQEWLRSDAAPSHQGFPIVGEGGRLLGVLTRRDLLNEKEDGTTSLRSLIKRAPVSVLGHHTLREAADLMVHTKVGRLPVITESGQVVGILTRSDVIAAHERRLDEGRRKAEATLWG